MVSALCQMAGLNNGACEYPFSELAKCRRFAQFRVFRQNNILCGERLRCTENILKCHTRTYQLVQIQL